jgi:Asp-tRNA(Asn)/Glu-tRNA(Gln) amidotransferase A subunit family amidase
VGVLARGVDDCALFLTVAAGHDPADPSSALQPVPAFSQARPPAPPRLGLVRAALERAAPRVRAHVEEVAGRFAAAGARVREVELEDPLDLVVAVHHVTMQTEAAAVHWQLLEQHPGAHAPRIRAYVEVGRLLPGALYLHAQRLRRRIREGLDRCVADVDALLLPTATDLPPPPDTTGDFSLQAPFSLVGLPAISLPSGLSAERLPLAIQLVAARWQEPRLLDVARWCEAQLGPLPAPDLGHGS